jgi:hypothetical protein
MIALIGELQNYRVGVPAGWQVLSADWNFEGSGGGVLAPLAKYGLYSDYIANSFKAQTIEPLSFSGIDLPLYFDENDTGLVYEVLVEYMAGGKRGSRTMGGFTFFTGPKVVWEDKSGQSALEVYYGKERDYLTLGREDLGLAGYEWQCDIQMPRLDDGSGGGYVDFAQEISGTVLYIDSRDRIYTLTLPLGVLDTRFPWHEELSLYPAGSPQRPTLDDSPAFWLPRQGCRAVAVDLSFKTHLMYRPISNNFPSTWVRIYTGFWNIKAAASKPGAVDPWIIAENQVTHGGSMNLGGNPTWDSNSEVLLAAFLAKLQAAFPREKAPDSLMLPRTRRQSVRRLMASASDRTVTLNEPKKGKCGRIHSIRSASSRAGLARA